MKHKFKKNSKYYTICVYAVISVLLCAIGIKLIYNWSETKGYIMNIVGVITPFIAGLFIAYLINPMAKSINENMLKPLFGGKRKGLRKGISIFLSYVIVIGIIAAILFYIVPQIVDTLSQMTNFISTAQTGYNQVIDFMNKIETEYPSIDLSFVKDLFKDIPNMLKEFLTSSLPELIPALYNTSMSVISVLIDSIIAVFVSVYILIDKHRLINNGKRVIYAVLGQEKGDNFLIEGAKCNEIFGGFIIGKAIDSTIIGFMCWGFMMILELPYALIISVIVGITNMIPYFGPFIGAVPGILLLLIVDFPYALMFAVLIFGLQQFDGIYLGPKILGESTGIRPLWIIFAISVGGFVAGVLGMFLGVPVVAVISYLLDKKFAKKLLARKIEFETDEETGIISRKDFIVDTTDEKNVDLSHVGMDE